MVSAPCRAAGRHPAQTHEAPPVGLEPTTRCLEGSRSIHLSYGGIASATTVAVHRWPLRAPALAGGRTRSGPRDGLR
jgi:hypothetical protein